MRKIIEFFAREHLIGNLITFLVFVFGTMSLLNLRTDIWPEVNFNLTAISTYLNGASPEQMENLVVDKIESSLNEVDGIDEIFSTATQNTAITIVKLDPDARDTNKTNRDIRSSIDTLQDLPEDATDPLIKEISTSVRPVLEVNVLGGKSSLERNEIAKNISEELERLDGVARVDKNGYLEKVINITASSEKLNSRNISISNIVDSLKLQNINLPGGSIENSKDQEVLVRTNGEIASESYMGLIEKISQSVVSSNLSGFKTSIKDIAQVTLDTEEPTKIYRTNGQETVNLIINKKANSNVLDMVELIYSKVEGLKAKYKGKVDLVLSNDLSVYLKTRLATLTSNLFIGLILVILVLSLFLPWQVTLVVSVGIPVALLATLTTIYLMGNSLNLISLIGLIIVMGMLVDDAIVVSENIWRHIEEGDSKITAVTDGAMEVLGPVTASVLTTISAFAPMFFMTGIFGAFISEIPLMVILALIFSISEAFLIMPSHFSSWVAPFVNPDKLKLKKKKGNVLFDKLLNRYCNFITWSLTKRYAMLGIVFSLLLASGVSLKFLGRFELFPSEGIEVFFVTLEAPIETSIEKMNRLVVPIEQEIAKIPTGDLKDYVTTIGIIQQQPNDKQTRRGTNYANIRISLTPQAQRDRTAEEIAEELRATLKTPEGLKKVAVEYLRNGPPQGRPISINLKGKDFTVLNKLAQEVIDELNKIKGTKDLRTSYVRGKDEMQVIPRQQDMLSLGLNTVQVANSVRASFQGLTATTIKDLTEEVDVIVRLEKQKGDTLSQIQNLKVGNPMGNLIPIKSIADIKVVPTVNAITHYNLDRVINVSGNIDTDIITSNEVISKVKDKFSGLIQKELDLGNFGYSLEYGGESKDTNESLASLGRAFLVAALLIFCLLIVTFKNFIQPILILTAVPLGFMGVNLAMLLHGRPFSFMAMLGVIALAGVIVNNAIVLIDFVNQSRKKGETLESSIVSAAKIRLRPILLTTTTTVCGLLPTAYGGFINKLTGIGGNDPFIVPIAIALAWGIGFGSVLTLLFFPSLIRISDDFKNFIDKRVANWLPSNN